MGTLMHLLFYHRGYVSPLGVEDLSPIETHSLVGGLGTFVTHLGNGGTHPDSEHPVWV